MLKDDITTLAKQAKQASLALALLNTAERNAILQAMAEGIRAASEVILQANQKDLAKAQAKGVPAAMQERLTLTPLSLQAMVNGIQQVAQLPDPLGEVLQEYQRPNGLIIRKVRVAIGVIAMIYEARPNVTADVAALALKTGNAVILRGGSEALASNQAILHAMLNACAATKLPPYAMQLITHTDHAAVEHLVQLSGLIDLVIPRGGESLIENVCRHARVPVIKHYKGICHTYVDSSADIDMALAICENAKCQRPGVCNAMETLLVNRDIAPTFLPKFYALMQQAGVECRGDAAALAIIPDMNAAMPEDWDTEYLSLILSIKIVDDVEAAIAHINLHGSHHSDAIISNNLAAQQRFLTAVDSAVVYVNASTRFTDGAEFGMGAELGISTDKLHARGPMGLAELTSYKYLVSGTGQVRR